MRSHIFISTLTILFSLSLFAQTPEQKKQMEEAQRKADSIMNSPMMKEMMAKTKAMQEEFTKREKVKKALKKSKPKTKPVAKAVNKVSKDTKDSFYWYNTIASNTNGEFSKWSYGSAKIRAAFFDRKKKGYTYVPIGSISPNGQINMQLPSIEIGKLPFKPITTPFSEGDTVFYFDHLNHTNPETKWVSTRFTLEVYQGDTVLGYLKMGNTIKPVVNLNSPCCIGKAGDGYTASWIYLTDSNSVKGEADSNTGGEIIHDMNFKQGWNLIKIEVSGTDKLNQWIHMKLTVLSNLPKDSKYYFTKR